MKLRELDADEYARLVLPHTATLWAAGRDAETYAQQTLESAASGYGKRHLRFYGFFDGNDLAASCKLYARTIVFGATRLEARGIGAVFTPEALRGRGYASAMIAMLLDRSRASGIDIAYLFSDIRPQFYSDLGFVELASRRISLRADNLPSLRVAVTPLAESDWPALRRCFEATEMARAWRFERRPLVWEWIRLRMRQREHAPVGTTANLVVRRGKSVVAYVLGTRAPAHDAFLLDEFGYRDTSAASLVPALLRNAAGDLRRIVGWLPPHGARELLPRGSVRKRDEAIFMAAALTPSARAWQQAATLPKPYDGVWSADHI